MKLHGFVLSAALAVTATASEQQQQHPVEAYILSNNNNNNNNQVQSAEAPELSNDLAEAILLQRLGAPSSLGFELTYNRDAIKYLNQFGKDPSPLFADGADEARQLVISLTGVAPEQYKDLKAVIPEMPVAFSTDGIAPLKVPSTKRFCTFSQSVDPDTKGCWAGRGQYLQYDLSKDAGIISQLSGQISALQSLAQKDKMETVFVISSPDAASYVSRRSGDEEVMTMDDPYISSSKPDFSDQSAAIPFAAGNATYKRCYDTVEACNDATSSCSGHGECMDRWRDADASCFACRCESTVEEDSKGRESIYHWGGAACQKRDVSVPAWLFFGTTLALLGTVGFSISLLYSIGEQKLPGVIGAGVSKSK